MIETHSPGSAIVLEACRSNPGVSSRTLARMIYASHGHLFKSIDAVRGQIRYRRGNMGNHNRRDAGSTELHRPNQQSGMIWKLPESKEDEWKSHTITEGRTLILSDVHIPFHDKAAVEAIVEWGKKWNPDCVLLNGDTCDFYAISRFEKNPTKVDFLGEIDDCRNFLGWLRGQFPKARIIFKEGNHDERLSSYIAQKAPELYKLPTLKLRHLLTGAFGEQPEIPGIEWVGDQAKIRAGHLTILHGHEMGKGSIAPPVNPARGFFLKTNDCVLAGHLHRTSSHFERSMNGRLIGCFSSGCLCSLSPAYARVNKWDQSGTILELSGDDFNVAPVKILNGRVIESSF